MSTSEESYKVIKSDGTWIVQTSDLSAALDMARSLSVGLDETLTVVDGETIIARVYHQELEVLR